MRTAIILCATLMVIPLTLVTGGADAAPFGGSAVVQSTVTVSGNWTSVQWYESDGCYSGVGDPEVSDWKVRAQNDTPVDLSTTASDANGSANSSITVAAPGLVPTINVSSDADVHGVLYSGAHWAMGYSQGGANWLTSGAAQVVDVTVEYAYDVSLVQAHPDPGSRSAYVKIYVALWGPGGELMLTPDAEFVPAGNYLVKEVILDTAGSSTGLVTGSKTWQVSVAGGSFYSFWSQADAFVWTSGPPTASDKTSWSTLKQLYQ